MSSPVPLSPFAAHFARQEDNDLIVELEQNCFPIDEAASGDTIRMRIEMASDFFVVFEIDDSICAFVNGTLTNSLELSHESMTNHAADGEYLCIHSVCVEESKRRRGLGSSILKYYLSSIKKTQPHVKCVLLLCKAHLISFYENCGFQMIGPLSVVHGSDQWFEMHYQCDEGESRLSQEQKI